MQPVTARPGILVLVMDFKNTAGTVTLIVLRKGQPCLK
jgi:hypothetical protein